MTIYPVAEYHTILEEKFGLPRQSGLADSLEGTITLKGEWTDPQALRGLELFTHIWVIWGFHLNEGTPNHTVRPPRLGGNRRIGVFASRSPFRPNGLGISALEITSINKDTAQIKVRGADLADGTPIYDIKPYIPYSDCIPNAGEGYATNEWKELQVDLPKEAAEIFSENQVRSLRQILALDPRPSYQDDPEREYGLLFASRNVKFKVKGNVLKVLSFEERS